MNSFLQRTFLGTKGSFSFELIPQTIEKIAAKLDLAPGFNKFLNLEAAPKHGNAAIETNSVVKQGINFFVTIARFIDKMKFTALPLSASPRFLMCEEDVDKVSDEFQKPYEFANPIITSATQLNLSNDFWNNYPYRYAHKP